MSGNNSNVDVMGINSNEIVKELPKTYRPPEQLFNLMDQEISFLYRRLTQSKYADRLNSTGFTPTANKMQTPKEKYVAPWYSEAKAKHKAYIESKKKTLANQERKSSFRSIMNYLNLNSNNGVRCNIKKKKRKHAHDAGSARCSGFKRRSCPP